MPNNENKNKGQEPYLPSIYAPGGLATPDPVSFGHKRHHSGSDRRVKRDSFDGHDIEMLDIDNEVASGSIANYIANERAESRYDSYEYPDIQRQRKSSTAKEDTLPANVVNSIREEYTPVINTTPVFLVIDTNFIISHLGLLDELRRMSLENNGILRLILPTMVIDELDGLKKSSRSGIGNDVAKLSRKAIDWYYSLLHNLDKIVKIQQLSERIDRSTVKDDAILDCCLYFQQKFKTSLVILLSDDKNLCAKAFAENLLTITFKQYMTGKIVFYTIIRENNSRMAHQQQQQQLQQQNLEYTNNFNELNDRHHPNYSTNNNASLGEGYYSNYEDMMYDSMDEEPYIPKPIVQPKPLGPIDFQSAKEQVFDMIEKLAMEAVQFILKEEYQDDLELVNYKLDDLNDCCEVIIRFSFTCFDPYLKRMGGLNPMKVLCARGSQRLSNTKLCRLNKISDEEDLLQFLEFWKVLLKSLYSERDKQLQDSLKQIYTHIDNLVSRIH